MEVKTNTLPAVGVTILGYLAAMLGGWMLRHGWITADQTQQVAGVVLGGGALLYGAIRTHLNRQKIVDAAMAPPNSITLK